MEIQEKILAGALELFVKYGVRSVSMDDIARHLSMSKKTLYQHFKDKDELVYKAAQAHMNEEIKKYNDVVEQSQNTIEQLVLINRCIRTDFSNMNPSLLFDLQKYHPKAWEIYLHYKNVDIKNHIAGILEQGVKEGYFRKEIEPEILSIIRVEIVQLAFNSELFPKEKYNFKDIQVMLFDHFVHGILTPKGQDLYNEYLNKNEFQELKK